MRAILTYHSIDDSGSPISVSRQTFSRHMEFLADSDIEVLPLLDLVGLGPRGPEHAVAITFDDGFANFATEAWPHLQTHELPATLFPVTGHLGRHNDWGGMRAAGIPHLPLMDWETLGSLHADGLDVGAHTVLHPRLTGLSDAALAQELASPLDALEDRLGLRPQSMAYPYGDLDPRVRERARALYRVAVGTRLASLSPQDDPCELPRLDMYYLRDPGRLESWGTVGFQAYLNGRRALRGIKRMIVGDSA